LSTALSKFRRLTPIDWVICGVACIGFAFDTYELLVLTLTVQPALTEFLTAKPGSAQFNTWIGVMFYVPAIAGGIFGLLGGYLIGSAGAASCSGAFCCFVSPRWPRRIRLPLCNC
jgi:hypothetical protein